LGKSSFLYQIIFVLFTRQNTSGLCPGDELMVDPALEGARRIIIDRKNIAPDFLI
jgi:hypothetical protein